MLLNAQALPSPWVDAIRGGDAGGGKGGGALGAPPKFPEMIFVTTIIH